MKKDRIFAGPSDRVEKFTFNQDVAEVFDDMIRRSVPLYDEIQRMTVEIAAQFAQPQSRIYDLGCATGTTLSLLAMAIHLPDVQFIGIDNADAMLFKAKNRLSDVVSCRNVVLENADLNERTEFSLASVIILNWTLQFVQPPNRVRLLRGIFAGLLNGGCLIILEKILPSDVSLSKLYTGFHHAFKRRNEYSDLEISQKRESLEKVLTPFRIEDNIALLQQVGFPLIDIFFRWYNFAGLIAIKR
jgi:tRNA (cmo5U34)-methyltransferase